MNNSGCFGPSLWGVWLAVWLAVAIYGDNWMFKGLGIYMFIISLKTIIKG